jgi:hypothetical protein
MFEIIRQFVRNDAPNVVLSTKVLDASEYRMRAHARRWELEQSEPECTLPGCSFTYSTRWIGEPAMCLGWVDPGTGREDWCGADVDAPGDFCQACQEQATIWYSPGCMGCSAPLTSPDECDRQVCDVCTLRDERADAAQERAEQRSEHYGYAFGSEPF